MDNNPRAMAGGPVPQRGPARDYEADGAMPDSAMRFRASLAVARAPTLIGKIPFQRIRVVRSRRSLGWLLVFFEGKCGCGLRNVVRLGRN
jgi:hypothetical protein